MPVTVVPTSFGDRRDRDVHHRAVERHQELAGRQRQQHDLTARRLARHGGAVSRVTPRRTRRSRAASSAGGQETARTAVSMPAAANSATRSRCASTGPSRKTSRTRPSGASSSARLRSPASTPRPAGRSRRRGRASGRNPRRRARSRTRRSALRRRERLLLGAVDREEAAGELLVRRPNARTTCSTLPSGRKFANTPSRFSAASRSIRSRSAASTIGTGCAGGDASLKPPAPRSPASTARR